MLKKLSINLLFISLTSVSLSTQAGIKELTWHSRANCINNESITWHLGYSYDLYVYSKHSVCYLKSTKDSKKCMQGTYHSEPNIGSYVNTWRWGVIHWGEPSFGLVWTVKGIHKLLDKEGKKVLLGETQTTNCSIYDGWWDQR